MERTCERCGRPKRAGRCGCAPPGRLDRSPTTRAQDAEYERERRRLLTPAPGQAFVPCHWCGAPATTTDHVVAVARGGRHRRNLVPACAPCNFARQARPAPVRT